MNKFCSHFSNNGKRLAEKIHVPSSLRIFFSVWTLFSVNLPHPSNKAEDIQNFPFLETPRHGGLTMKIRNHSIAVIGEPLIVVMNLSLMILPTIV